MEQIFVAAFPEFLSNTVLCLVLTTWFGRWTQTVTEPEFPSSAHIWKTIPTLPVHSWSSLIWLCGERAPGNTELSSIHMSMGTCLQGLTERCVLLQDFIQVTLRGFCFVIFYKALIIKKTKMLKKCLLLLLAFHRKRLAIKSSCSHRNIFLFWSQSFLPDLWGPSWSRTVTHKWALLNWYQIGCIEIPGGIFKNYTIMGLKPRKYDSCN